MNRVIRPSYRVDSQTAVLLDSMRRKLAQDFAIYSVSQVIAYCIRAGYARLFKIDNDEVLDGL